MVGPRGGLLSSVLSGYCGGQLSRAVAGVLAVSGAPVLVLCHPLPNGRESAAGPGGHWAQASSTCTPNSTSDSPQWKDKWMQGCQEGGFGWSEALGGMR